MEHQETERLASRVRELTEEWNDVVPVLERATERRKEHGVLRPQPVNFREKAQHQMRLSGETKMNVKKRQKKYFEMEQLSRRQGQTLWPEHKRTAEAG